MNRKLIAALVLVFKLLFLSVLSAAAQTQTNQSPCTPGISFWKLLEAVSDLPHNKTVQKSAAEPAPLHRQAKEAYEEWKQGPIFLISS